MENLKKFITNKKSIISLLIAVLICLSFQITAYAASTSFEKNLTGKNNYTLCTGTKATNNDYVSFRLTKGNTLNVWAGYQTSGIIITETIIIKTSDTSAHKAYFRALVNPEIGDKLRARGELNTSSSSIVTCKGYVDFR